MTAGQSGEGSLVNPLLMQVRADRALRFTGKAQSILDRLPPSFRRVRVHTQPIFAGAGRRYVFWDPLRVNCS